MFTERGFGQKGDIIALPRYICPQCGHESRGCWVRQGAGAIEVILWLTFIIPGLLYSSYRTSNSYRGCPKCEEKMIPRDSPRGQHLRRVFGKMV